MEGAIGKVNPEGWLMRWDGWIGSDQIRSYIQTYMYREKVEEGWKDGRNDRTIPTLLF